MGQDEMLQVMKEKMRLEGQLESLSSEANQVTKHIDVCTHILCFFSTVHPSVHILDKKHANHESH